MQQQQQQHQSHESRPHADVPPYQQLPHSDGRYDDARQQHPRHDDRYDDARQQHDHQHRPHQQPRHPAPSCDRCTDHHRHAVTVTGIGLGCTYDDVGRRLCRAGRLLELDVPKDRFGMYRGYAFARFESCDALDRAWSQFEHDDYVDDDAAAAAAAAVSPCRWRLSITTPTMSS
jgi:hypothetical protein